MYVMSILVKAIDAGHEKVAISWHFFNHIFSMLIKGVHFEVDT